MQFQYQCSLIKTQVLYLILFHTSLRLSSSHRINTCKKKSSKKAKQKRVFPSVTNQTTAELVNAPSNELMKNNLTGEKRSAKEKKANTNRACNKTKHHSSCNKADCVLDLNEVILSVPAILHFNKPK
jgi:hypothetical protein